jgi:hypothetical protein
MCWLEDHYQRVMAEQFAKELSLNPDGILQDECQHHSAHLCFDHKHSHRYGGTRRVCTRSSMCRLGCCFSCSHEPLSFATLFGSQSPLNWFPSLYSTL